MKRLITKQAAIVTCTVAAFFFTSCIYDSAGDKFYRTLWESAEMSGNAADIGEQFNASGQVSGEQFNAS